MIAAHRRDDGSWPSLASLPGNGWSLGSNRGMTAESVDATLQLLYCSYTLSTYRHQFFSQNWAVHDEEARPDNVLYHFCFPTYGIAVPMTK